MLVYLILIAVVLVFLPTNAYAWGPGTHLEMATTLLKDAALFSPAVAAIIKKYKNEFIYGMVAADVLFAKKLAGYLHHCHNWSVGWKVLSKCTTEKEKAAAYGYLSHLATDIVAHNFYVPYMIVKHYNQPMKNHTYWEMRFDMHVLPHIWERMRAVVSDDHEEFDLILEKNLKRPFLSFQTHKRIFTSILLLQNLRQMRRAVAIHSGKTSAGLTDGEVRYYKHLALVYARDLLTRLKTADCVKGHPAGLEKLAIAGRLRKSLKKNNQDAETILVKFRQTLKDGMLSKDIGDSCSLVTLK